MTGCFEGSQEKLIFISHLYSSEYPAKVHLGFKIVVKVDARSR
jgi:hypothetical protein